MRMVWLGGGGVRLPSYHAGGFSVNQLFSRTDLIPSSGKQKSSKIQAASEASFVRLLLCLGKMLRVVTAVSSTFFYLPTLSSPLPSLTSYVSASPAPPSHRPPQWIQQPNCKTPEWMPWGGLVWIWIRMSLYEDFQLPKLRLDAVGRVWWDLDVPSCG